MLSIIIPTLNEEDRIGKLLKHLKSIAPGAELIVVDGGSSDRTCSIAQDSTLVLSAQRGRGVQMNYGAQAAAGEILWFLHADCLPKAECVSALYEALEQPELVGGAFCYEFDDGGWVCCLSARVSNCKNRLKNKIYGDMGIFVRKEVFVKLGGYKEARLMEDFEFGRRLRTAGRVRILDPKITTSARDWRRVGPIRKLIKDSVIKTSYNLGVSSDRLYEWYYGK